jgi:4-hydroxybenzoate polyprenyltransferase
LTVARSSNLPTVWTNVLAGIVAAGAFSWHAWLWLAMAASLLYTGGMYTNDAFDAPVDAARRSDRPIPAGEVSRITAFVGGFVLLFAGLVVTVHVRSTPVVAVAGAVLVAAIVYYNVRHKHDTLGPLVMGACRGLVYIVAGAAVAGTVPRAVWIGAACVTAYVVMLTAVAKRVGPRAGVIVPRLIAGISLVDAIVILGCGSISLAMLAVAGGAATLSSQRIVSGD